MRQYRSGARWAVWRWMSIIINGNLYLRRLHLWHTPFGGIMVHWIPRPDAQRHLHDHPSTFWSLILRGWYVEVRKEGKAEQGFSIYTPGHINRLRASPSVTHRIVGTDPRTMTLVFYGPRRRTWGFHTEEGWVPWQEYPDPAYVTSKTAEGI